MSLLVPISNIKLDNEWNVDPTWTEYTRSVEVFVTWDRPNDQLLMITYRVAYYNWGLDYHKFWKYWILWNTDIGENYETLKTIQTGQSEDALWTEMVNKGDGVWYKIFD